MSKGNHRCQENTQQIADISAAESVDLQGCSTALAAC